MRVLLVGAGPVGCVTGYHLARGGAEVAFLVKEAHAAEARAGFRVRRLPRRAPAERFHALAVHAAVDDVDPSVDVVVLCVSSPALRRGPWLEELLARCPEALVVGLQPGVDDEEQVARRAGRRRAAWGLVPFVAYAAPLPGEEVEPEVAVWLPPGARMPFSGGDGRLDAVIEALTRGGLPARRVADAGAMGALASPLLNLHMAALERAGWRLDGVRADRALLRLATRATREALDAVSAARGRSAPWWRGLPFHVVVPALARLAPRTLPFDVEAYLRIHFTKVGDQTREQIARWVALAEEAGLPSGALRALAGELGAPGVAAGRGAR